LAHSSDLRVFIAHGTQDAIIEIDNGRQAYDELLANGFDVTFHEFDGGHEVPEIVVHAAEQWMRAVPAEESGEE
jgi:predicted esterase